MIGSPYLFMIRIKPFLFRTASWWTMRPRGSLSSFAISLTSSSPVSPKLCKISASLVDNVGARFFIVALLVDHWYGAHYERWLLKNAETKLNTQKIFFQLFLSRYALSRVDTVRQLYLIFLLMVVVIDTIVSIMVKHTLSDRKFMTKKRWIIVAAVAILGILLGRLAVRAFLNLLLGGTLLGGNFL